MPGATELPDHGLLSFFYHAEQATWGFDPADAGSFAVLYTPSAESLVRREPPSDLPDDAVFGTTALQPQSILSLAPEDAALAELDLDEREREAYCELLEALSTESPEPQHQVLGYPAAIQGDMQLECQLVTNGLYCGDPRGYNDPRAKGLEPGARDWRLLLQVDSDDEAGMMWGDVGMLYFWMREADLLARRFDRAWMILQCT